MRTSKNIPNFPKRSHFQGLKLKLVLTKDRRRRTHTQTHVQATLSVFVL